MRELTLENYAVKPIKPIEKKTKRVRDSDLSVGTRVLIKGIQ
jgi:hypothetical protein